MFKPETKPELFSVHEPAPSLDQYLYSSFRKSVMYMSILGLPVLVFFMVYYTYTFNGVWYESLYRLPAVIGTIVISLILLIREYRPYILWLIIIIGLLNYASISYHALVVVDSDQAMAHVFGGIIIFVVAIMAIAPMLSLQQFLVSVVLGAFMPELLVLVVNHPDYMDSAMRVRIFLSAVFVVLLGIKLRRDSIQAYLLQLRLHQASQSDPMSRVYNRTGLFAHLNVEMQRLQREKSRLGLMLIDIDFFKKVNDQYGHPSGDLVIKALGKIFRQEIRPYDLVGRIGGEEFLIAVISVGKQQLLEMAERVRQVVDATIIQDKKQRLHVSVSIGLSMIDFATTGSTLSEAIKVADEAMYKAKQYGRNRVEFGGNH